MEPKYKPYAKTVKWLALAAVILFQGCFKDDTIIEPPAPSDPWVTFSVKVPGANTVTRSLTGQQEDAISTVEVLYFEPDGGDYKGIAYGELTETALTYKVKIPKGRFDLMVLANARDYIGSLTPGTDMETTVGSLTVSLSGKWETDDQLGNYKPIPMWGWKKNQLVDGNSLNDPIQLSRMLARVNVHLQQDASDVFELKTVSLFNRQSAGRVIPLLDDAHWDYSECKALLPSCIGNRVKGPLTYSDTDGSGMVQEIYVFEAPAGSKEEHPDYPCIVLGGMYNNQMTYYRVDFVGTGSKMLSLLRNHTYEVVVSEIKGPGYGNVDDAYESNAVNITASVLEWDDGAMESFIIGEDCFLSITPAELTFDMTAHSWDAEDNDVTFLPTGRTGGSWLTLLTRTARIGSPFPGIPMRTRKSVSRLKFTLPPTTLRVRECARVISISPLRA